jgi:hypothetical protein
MSTGVGTVFAGFLFGVLAAALTDRFAGALANRFAESFDRPEDFGRRERDDVFARAAMQPL